MRKDFKDLTIEELKELSDLIGRPYTEEDDRKYKEKYPYSIEEEILMQCRKNREIEKGIESSIDHTQIFFKNLLIQLQSINDHLSWISESEKHKYLTPQGYPIKCVSCKSVHAHNSQLLNVEELFSGICERCRKKCYQESYKIREAAGRITELEKKTS